MKRFEIITEADARSLDIGATVELAAGGHVTPLARDTLLARRVTAAGFTPRLVPSLGSRPVLLHECPDPRGDESNAGEGGEDWKDDPAGRVEVPREPEIEDRQKEVQHPFRHGVLLRSE